MSASRYLEKVAVDTARQLADGTLKVNRERPLVEKLMQKVCFLVSLGLLYRRGPLLSIFSSCVF